MFYKSKIVINFVVCCIEECVRLLFRLFFLSPLLYVLLIGFMSSNIVLLIDLGNSSMYSSRQTSCLKIVWCTSKIKEKYVDMQTTQSFHFPRPTYIVHSWMDSIRIYKKIKRFLALDNMDPPKNSINFA